MDKLQNLRRILGYYSVLRCLGSCISTRVLMYSQVEGVDFDKTYAATLPGCCLRLWCTIVADEDLETDSIDAVKAFTQSYVDRPLHVEMPIGF